MENDAKKKIQDEPVENVKVNENEGKRRHGKKRRARKGMLFVLHLLQHTFFTAAVVLTVTVLAGSYLAIETRQGITLYDLSREKNGIAFEESALFSELLGNSAYDVIGYAAIRGQLEEQGEYDARKVIDVTAYAKRYDSIPSEYITARYYLEDLLKWSRSGYEYEEAYLTGEEADEFLSRYHTVTKVDLEQGAYNGGTVTCLNSDMDSMIEVRDVSGNEFASGDYQREDVNATILNNRYHTIEGKNIENYVATWDAYYELCGNVKKAADDLSAVYEKYTDYSKLYQEGNTNVVYFVRKTIGDTTEVYTNMELKEGVKDIQELKEELLSRCDSYVYYDPSEMEYETNTMVEEATLRYLFNGYEYAYPEDTQIMLGVDRTYPAVDSLDGFYQAKTGFGRYVPYSWQYLVAAVVCAGMFLLMVVVLSVSEGCVGKTAEGKKLIRLKKEDAVPTELMLLLWAVLGFGIYCFTDLIVDGFWMEVNSTIMIIFAGVMAVLVSLWFSFFYYSFVRRGKAGSFWKASLARRAGLLFKEGIRYAYRHTDVVLRTWLPFGGFVFLQILLVYLAAVSSRLRPAAILLLLLLDAGVGALIFCSAKARQRILMGIRKINEGDISHKVEEKGMYGDDLVMARAVNSIGDSVKNAVETSMKDERLKADLITNVSHDIKTPLTSIINYIDLIKRADVQDERIREYVEVLDAKSQRLKQLTDDLVEASKISSGNVVLQWEKINLVELLNQTIGEFSEKFKQKSLVPIFHAPAGSVSISADSRRIWRVIENLFNNIFKYALEGTRVYIDMEFAENPEDPEDKWVTLSIKNISATPLKVDVKELTERFIRGDESRTTEGSGLGLSIAKNLTEMQKGYFDIVMDGDLFKVNLSFPLLETKS